MGIQKLEIGKGDDSWDKTPAPAPDPDTTTGLVDTTPHLINISHLTTEFLLPNGDPATDFANHIQITVQLDAGTPLRLLAQRFTRCVNSVYSEN